MVKTEDVSGVKLAMGRKGNMKCYRNVTWKRKERKGRSVDE